MFAHGEAALGPNISTAGQLQLQPPAGFSSSWCHMFRCQHDTVGMVE